MKLDKVKSSCGGKNRKTLNLKANREKYLVSPPTSKLKDLNNQISKFNRSHDKTTPTYCMILVDSDIDISSDADDGVICHKRVSFASHLSTKYESKKLFEEVDERPYTQEGNTAGIVPVLKKNKSLDPKKCDTIKNTLRNMNKIPADVKNQISKTKVLNKLKIPNKGKLMTHKTKNLVINQKSSRNSRNKNHFGKVNNKLTEIKPYESIGNATDC
jgi:hypothetical protein